MEKTTTWKKADAYWVIWLITKYAAVFYFISGWYFSMKCPLTQDSSSKFQIYYLKLCLQEQQIKSSEKRKNATNIAA